jgi:6-pyruvoyltetrahydropterin/6-carboxytetrahydropterin synthase
MDVTRSYEFSAAHRLHSDGLSDAQNLAVFGKCNNPRGHGHNYVLEVTLRGAVDANGELLDAGTFDRVVVESVVDRWDHKNLNEDLDEFRGVNPTAEEIARVAWDRIRAQLARVTGGGGRVALHRVKLRETARNHVEYYGGES